MLEKLFLKGPPVLIRFTRARKILKKRIFLPAPEINLKLEKNSTKKEKE